jgi:hypothetical protein
MANTQTQFGFRHLGYISGASPDYQQSSYAIQSTLATTIGFGDPVCRVNATSAYITRMSALAAATTGGCLGIFVGCNFTPVGGLGIPQWSPGWTAPSVTGDAVGYVIDAPNAKFLVAALNTAITTANIGQAVNFTGGAPSTTGQMLSTATIDQSTATTSYTTASILPFRIVGLYKGVGNGSDPTTAFNWVEVTFNMQVNRSLAGF